MKIHKRHLKDAHNGRPIYVWAMLPEEKVIPLWSVWIGDGGDEKAQAINVFRMRCMDMWCDDWNTWVGQCTRWMNSHNTFGGDLTIPEVEDALRAVVKAFGGRKKFEAYYSNRKVEKREELPVPIYEATSLVADIKWAEGAAILQREDD